MAIVSEVAIERMKILKNVRAAAPGNILQFMDQRTASVRLGLVVELERPASTVGIVYLEDEPGPQNDGRIVPLGHVSDYPVIDVTALIDITISSPAPWEFVDHQARICGIFGVLLEENNEIAITLGVRVLHPYVDTFIRLSGLGAGRPVQGGRPFRLGEPKFTPKRFLAPP